MKKLRIVMVIGLFKPFVGGAEKQAALLGKTLMANNIDVSLITSLHRNIAKTFNDDPFPVSRIGMPGLRKVSDFVFIINLFILLIMRRKQFDIIHVHQAGLPSFAAVLAANLLKIPVIIKCSNSGYRFDLDYLAREVLLGLFFSKFIAKYAHCFVAINQEVADQLKEWGVEDKRIISIPNGVKITKRLDAAERKTERIKMGLMDHEIAIMGVGSLTIKKDFHTLIQALSYIKNDAIFRLNIFGGGPLLSELEREAKELGLDETIHFMGKVDSKVVQHYLKISDLFVLPSLTEGVSNALLEAMAAGVFCIASDIPGNKKVINHLENGMLFEVGNPKALGKCIGQFIKRAEFNKLIQVRARQKIKKQFDITKISNAYINQYFKMLELYEK